MEGSGRAGRLGSYGVRPVMMEKGGSPVIRFEVKRSIARAGGRWLLQNVAGSFVSPRRMVSFSVRIVRST